MAEFPGWTEQYVGTPYHEADCWSLARRVLAEQYAVHIPADIHEAMEYGRHRFKKVSDPQAGDIVMLRVEGRPHIGVMVSSEAMLHTGQGKNAVVERISAAWHKVTGYYRV